MKLFPPENATECGITQLSEVYFFERRGTEFQRSVGIKERPQRMAKAICKARRGCRTALLPLQNVHSVPAAHEAGPAQGKVLLQTDPSQSYKAYNSHL